MDAVMEHPRRPRHRVALRVSLGLLVALGYAATVWWLFQQVRGVIPESLTLGLFGYAKTVGNIPERIANIVSLMFVIIPAAFVFEASVTGWQRSSLRRILCARTPSIRLDIACLVTTEGQVMSALRLLLTVGLASMAGKWINTHLGDLLGFTKTLAALPLLVQLPLYYLVHTFFDYWDHRVEHRRIFWPFHRFHHSAQDFCMLTTMRQHPAAFVALFVINVPMAILGATLEVMIYVNVIVHVVGLFQHSNIDSNYGWVGRWLVQSPNHHRKHHILDISKPVGHFSMMPLWDRLFGTWAGDGDQTLVIGVDKPYRHGYLFFIDLFRDYLDFWKGLFGIKVDSYDFSQAKPPRGTD